MTQLPPIESGEALPVNFTLTAAVPSGTVTGWISVNGAAPEEFQGVMDPTGISGYVPFPGSKMVVPAGQSQVSYIGEVVITQIGQIWSPRSEKFTGVINASVRPQ